MTYYVLDGRVPRECDSLTWALWFENSRISRQVARSVTGGVEISTVFLGLDHQWGDGPPLLFETMIFGGWYDGQQDRCSTWEQAEKSHALAVRRVRALRWIAAAVQFKLRCWWRGVERGR